MLGLGDDCAVVRPPAPNEELLFTTDMIVEDVHFRRRTQSPAALGRRALARGLSDIAAMGGDSRYTLVSLALPTWAGRRWLKEFYRGLLALSKETGTALAGGDLSRADKLVCDVVVCGSVPKGKALRRDRARPGDAIYVSGSLGGAALGLRTGKGKARKRLSEPEPRLRLGRHLRRKVRVGAAMDLSDGLSLDLHRLSEASAVAAVVDRPLPVFPGAALEDALHGGEDYELLFTVRSGAKVPRSFEGIPLTRIGTMQAGKPGTIEAFGWTIEPAGWDHFKTR